MTHNKPPAEGQDMTLTGITGQLEKYGPYAFSIVSLLAIWGWVVKPELDAKRLEFEQHMTVLQQMSEQNHDSERVSRMLHETAIILDRAAARLERDAE